MPMTGCTNRQPPSVQPAIAFWWLANGPVGLAPTIHACPITGAVGGSFRTPWTEPATQISNKASASFTVVSFCAWPASMAVLRPAQGFRFARRIEERLCPVRPGQAPDRTFIGRPPPWRPDRKQPALAFHHHAARFVERRSDQRDPRLRIVLGHAAHPFRTQPGLAEPAPGHDQPHPPVVVRRKLGFPRPG